MSAARIRCGFIPLVDCAPLVVAQELGYAAEEGVELELLRQPSWSAIRDALVLDAVDCAQMLSPMPVAMSMGLGGLPGRVDALMVLSVNGNTIGVSPELAARMRANGWTASFRDPAGTGQQLIRATERRLRLGVPFPFSMHAELVYHWLGALGMHTPGELDVRTVPPPHMAAALAAGEIDAFCVGEPWGSYAVEQGTGELILPGNAIWAFAPEKVLGARHDWIEANPDLVEALMRAVIRAARWLGDPANRGVAGEMLSRPEYLNLPAELIDRSLTGRIVTGGPKLAHETRRFLVFWTGAATFPWKSQAAWIGANIARRTGMDRDAAIATAKASYRSDLYRRYLAPLGIDMPGASEKLEGSLAHEEAVASTRGQLILGPDRFFDGSVFDPAVAG